MKYKNVEIIETKYNKEARHLSYDVTYRELGSNEVVTKSTYPNASFVYGVSWNHICLLYTSPSPRDGLLSRMPSSA